MNRRKACQLLGVSLATPLLVSATEEKFRLRFVLSSALFGDLPLATVLAAALECSCESVDIWRKPHGSQREHIEGMGDVTFQDLLKKHATRMSASTCYPLGPFKQDDEMRWVKKNGGSMTICAAGAMGENDLSGSESKKQVASFFEKLKPHYELAEELGVTMAIENHKNSLLSSPDSIRYFAELNPSKNVGIAFAPHHLYDAIDEIPQLIRDCGKENIPFFYFQEEHRSSKKKMSSEESLKQMPGFGSLDYKPVLEALREIKFQGHSEIFMHPVPRGIPILDTPQEIIAAINKSRSYLEKFLS